LLAFRLAGRILGRPNELVDAGIRH
jgi:hypothetical protein